jgi:hypothetical protein
MVMITPQRTSFGAAERMIVQSSKLLTVQDSTSDGLVGGGE